MELRIFVRKEGNPGDLQVAMQYGRRSQQVSNLSWHSDLDGNSRIESSESNKKTTSNGVHGKITSSLAARL